MKKLIFVTFTLFTTFCFAGSKEIKLKNYESNYKDVSVKENTLYYKSGVYNLEQFSKLPIAGLNQNHNYEGAPFSVVVAKAYFLVDPQINNMSVEDLNSVEFLKQMYNAKLKATYSQNEYDLEKSKMLLKIKFNIKTDIAYNLTFTSPKAQTLLETSLHLDGLTSKHLKSAYHELSDFSRIFNDGMMVANFYEYKDGQILVSAYATLNIRNSALKSIDRFLLFSSAEKSLKGEIYQTLKTIFKKSQGKK
jgi:hypothetical protein